MANPSRLQVQYIAQIMRASRKRRGLSQSEVARDLNVSQSKLSKMERGLLVPSAPEWFQFCISTDTQFETLSTGYVDHKKIAVLQHKDRQGLFRIPSRFSNDQGSKIRSVRPFLWYLEQQLGHKTYLEFLKHLGFDPDYFVFLDNQVNLQLIYDVSAALIKRQLISPNNLTNLARPYSEKRLHGSLSEIYIRNKTPHFLVKSIIDQVIKYDCNFVYVIEDENDIGITFSVRPEKHIAQFDDQSLGEFLCRYKKEALGHFIRGFGSHLATPMIQEFQCMYHGANRCVYKVTFPFQGASILHKPNSNIITA